MPNDESKPLAFILMPFDTEFDRIYERLIKPSIEEEGYEVRRADTNLHQRNIMRTIIEGIANADLIVAELTSNNANVFYELGVAHGLRKPVIMISQDLDQVPFDLRSYNVVLYSTDVFEVENFKVSLRDLARRRIEGTANFENPVSDFAPTETIPASQSSTTIAPVRNSDRTVAEEGTGEPTLEDRGVLDFTSGAEAAMEEIGGIATSLTGYINDFAIQMAARAAEVEAIGGSHAPGSAARMLRLANEMARDMTGFSDNIDTELPAFQDAWENFERDFTNALSTLSIDDEEAREAADGLLSILDELSDGLRVALEGIDQGRGQFDALRGNSATLNAAVRRIERSLESLYEGFSTGESIVIRTRNLLDQKLQDS